MFHRSPIRDFSRDHLLLGNVAIITILILLQFRSSISKLSGTNLLNFLALICLNVRQLFCYLALSLIILEIIGQVFFFCVFIYYQISGLITIKIFVVLQI
ncbi:hypothetical protein KEM48_004921 [Puccinia striiformis f. sp. tritici PST-130]|nr:hypothetical protein KEM48_004921 [Puccinia striiformis f. sp. tritici PST-130]